MNLQEAYSILDLPQSASPEEAKKKYREFTKKYHPDINKETDANDKFKIINEAYQCVVNGKGTDKENPSSYNPFQGGFQNPFGNSKQKVAENIKLYTTISFRESILGCNRDLHFTRNGKCTSCNGQGNIQLNNGCDKCGGHGQVISKQGNMIFTRTCDKCGGQSSSIPCTICLSKGCVENTISINVNIPGGVIDGNILRLNGFGNYVGSFMNMEQYTEAQLYLSVVPEEGLSLDSNDVVSNLDITLLDALQGSQKTVKTILGDKDIFIPALSKNKDEIKIPNLGVNKIGYHRVIIKINYPDNIEDIINVLNGYKTFDPDNINLSIDLDSYKE